MELQVSNALKDEIVQVCVFIPLDDCYAQARLCGDDTNDTILEMGELKVWPKQAHAVASQAGASLSPPVTNPAVAFPAAAHAQSHLALCTTGYVAWVSGKIYAVKAAASQPGGYKGSVEIQVIQDLGGGVRPALCHVA